MEYGKNISIRAWKKLTINGDDELMSIVFGTVWLN